MNASLFIEVHGKERAAQVAADAGTSYPYFQHIAKGRRRPSVELAKKLVAASDGELDLLSLLSAVDWSAKREAQV